MLSKAFIVKVWCFLHVLDGELHVLTSGNCQTEPALVSGQLPAETVAVRSCEPPPSSQSPRQRMTGEEGGNLTLTHFYVFFTFYFVL